MNIKINSKIDYGKDYSYRFQKRLSLFWEEIIHTWAILTFKPSNNTTIRHKKQAMEGDIYYGNEYIFPIK